MPKRGRANGEGSTPRKRKDGRWQANYTVYLGGARKLKSVYGWTRAECSAKLAKAIAKRDGGVVFDSKNIALGGYLERWLTNSVQDSVKQRTYDGYAYIARKHIIPELGRVRLKDLTSEHIQALYRHKLDSGLSNRTVRYIYQTLNPALKQAVRWRLIPFNPAEETKPPRKVKRETRVLSKQEVTRFFKAARKERLGPLYTVAAITGLREGELLGLRWSDVDFDAPSGPTLRLQQKLVRSSKGITFEPYLKGDEGRAVMLPKVAVAALWRQRKQQREQSRGILTTSSFAVIVEAGNRDCAPSGNEPNPGG